MDSPQRPWLPGYPCLMALVCDLQSMLHKNLSHFTVINKTPCTVPQVCVLYLLAQVAKFLTMCPKSDKRYLVFPSLMTH